MPEVRGVDAQVVALGGAPCLAAIVVVVVGATAVGLLDELVGLLFGDAFLADHACYAVFEIGGEEEVYLTRMVAQDIVGTAAYEDARFLLSEVAYDVALHLEEGIVAQARVGRAEGVGCRAVREDGMEESVTLLLIGILEKLLSEATLLGCQLDELAVVRCDTIMTCQHVGDAASATAELSADVDDEMFVHDIFLLRSSELLSPELLKITFYVF